MSGCSPFVRARVWVPRTWPCGGHWLLCVWPGATVLQRGGNLVQALPTSPQIQGLHLTLVRQVQGRVVEDEPAGNRAERGLEPLQATGYPEAGKGTPTAGPKPTGHSCWALSFLGVGCAVGRTGRLLCHRPRLILLQVRLAPPPYLGLSNPGQEGSCFPSCIRCSFKMSLFYFIF